jgi:hypothetical protein
MPRASELCRGGVSCLAQPHSSRGYGPARPSSSLPHRRSGTHDERPHFVLLANWNCCEPPRVLTAQAKRVLSTRPAMCSREASALMARSSILLKAQDSLLVAMGSSM